MDISELSGAFVECRADVPVEVAVSRWCDQNVNEIFPDHMYAVDGDGIEIMTELFSLDWVLEEVVSVRDDLR